MNDKIFTSNFKDYVAVAADRGHGSMQLATYYVELFLLKRFDVPLSRLSVIFPFIVYKGSKENNKELKFNTLINAELSPICHLLAFLGVHHIFHVSRIKVNDSHTFLSSPLVCLTPVCLLITTFSPSKAHDTNFSR
jgi:hypothetical protein